MGKEDKEEGLSADSLNRKEGYYWVKSGNKFIIANWSYGWWIIGYNYSFVDKDFDYIDERQICRS